MSIVLKVSTDALKTKAGEVRDETRILENHISQLQSIVEKTTGYWIGIAGDKARKEFLGQKENTELVLKRFREHPDDLLKMAGIYEQSEQNIAAANQMLETDFII